MSTVLLNSYEILDSVILCFVLVFLMVINVSVHYNGGFLTEIILLTLCDNIGEEPF